MRPQVRVPCSRVTSHSMASSDKPVLALPTHTLKRSAGANCESANRRCHASPSTAWATPSHSAANNGTPNASAGSIGNTHFLAIPFNARAKEGAQVLIDFLLSPQAQARKADIRFWGDPTVLALDRLAAADKALFAQAQAPGVVMQAAPALPEPHASWVEAIEREWLKRYGQ